MYYVKFTVGDSARVVGRFQAAGGSGNDIQVVVAEEDAFENWRNGHETPVLYHTDKITVGNIDVPISRPGTRLRTPQPSSSGIRRPDPFQEI